MELIVGSIYTVTKRVYHVNPDFMTLCVLVLEPCMTYQTVRPLTVDDYT